MLCEITDKINNGNFTCLPFVACKYRMFCCRYVSAIFTVHVSPNDFLNLLEYGLKYMASQILCYKFVFTYSDFIHIFESASRSFYQVSTDCVLAFTITVVEK